MLDLIVLGYVPGTSVQLTFDWVLGIACVLAGVSLLRYTISRIIQRHKARPDTTTVLKAQLLLAL